MQARKHYTLANACFSRLHLLIPSKKEMEKEFSVAGDIYYKFIKGQDVLIIQFKLALL